MSKRRLVFKRGMEKHHRFLQVESLEERNLLAVWSGNESFCPENTIESALSSPIASTSAARVELTEATQEALIAAIDAVDNGGTIVFHDSLNGSVLEFSSVIETSKSFSIDAMSLFDPETQTLGMTFQGGNETSFFDFSGTATVSFAGVNFDGGYSASDGGAIDFAGTSLSISSCLFSNNTSGGFGGAICFSGDSLTIDQSSFSTNAATLDGGGVCVLVANNAGELTVTQSSFNDNSAGNETEDGYGGAILAEGPLSVSSCFLGNNFASADGGAIYSVSTVLIDLTDLNANSCGGYGGGIYAEASVTTNYCVFSSNIADVGYGGAVYGNSVLTFNDSGFWRNESDRGGAVYAKGTTYFVNSLLYANFANLGGAVYTYDGTTTFVNSTVSGNGANYGGALYLYAENVVLNNSLVVMNLATDQAADIYRSNYGVVTSNSSLVGSEDPGFVVAPIFENNQLTNFNDLNFALVETSASVNAGNNELVQDADGVPLLYDYIGNPRISAGTVDQGAYEFKFPEMPSVVVTTAEDVVDAFDYKISLREAISYAGTHDLGTIITFDPAVFESQNVITLDQGVLTIEKTLTINASVFYNAETLSPGITVQGSSDPLLQGALFNISAGTGSAESPVTLIGLTLTGGRDQASGGAIKNEGSLSVQRCTISQNSVEAVGTSSVYGGGICSGLTSATATLSVDRCLFEHNTATGNFAFGGGIYHGQGTVTVVNSQFRNNSASTKGGAIFNGGTLSVSLSLFEQNSSLQGGGIFQQESSVNQENLLTVRECTFLQNTANDQGAAIQGAEQSSNRSVMDVSLSVFQENTGAAIKGFGGTISQSSILNNTDLGLEGAGTISECTISGNQRGGLLFAGVIQKSRITANSAPEHGGGICCAGELTIVNSFVTDNVVTGEDSSVVGFGSGGGIYVASETNVTLSQCVITGNSVQNNGGALYSQGGIITLKNCTIAGNSANQGGGLFLKNGILTALNSILVQNSAIFKKDVAAQNTTCVANNTLSTYSQWMSSEGNLVYNASKPLFVDAAHGDYSLTDDAQGIDLGNDAYAVDEMDNPLQNDMAGNKRFIRTVDMGAYESLVKVKLQATLTLSQPDASIAVHIPDIEGAANFTLRYSTDPNFTTYSQLFYSSPGTKKVSGVNDDSIYYFKLMAGAGASDEYITSNWSPVVSILTKIKLQALSSLVVTSVFNQETYDAYYEAGTPNLSAKSIDMTVRWSKKVSRAVGYIVQYSMSPSFKTYEELEYATPGSYTIPNLTGNKTYYVRIAAKADPESVYGNSEWFTTSIKTKKVTLKAPELVLSSTGGNVLFYFDTVYAARNYSVRYSTDPTFATYTSRYCPSGNVTRILPKLNQNTVYYFKAVSSNSDTTSSFTGSKWSDVQSILVKIPLAKPTLSVLDSTSSTVRLNIGAVDNAVRYVIRYALKSSMVNYEEMTVGEAGIQTVENLQPSTTYYFRVYAQGEGAYANSPLSALGYEKTAKVDIAALEPLLNDVFEEDAEWTIPLE